MQAHVGNKTRWYSEALEDEVASFPRRTQVALPLALAAEGLLTQISASRRIAPKRAILSLAGYLALKIEILTSVAVITIDLAYGTDFKETNGSTSVVKEHGIIQD